jgi:hypothetical protein
LAARGLRSRRLNAAAAAAGFAALTGISTSVRAGWSLGAREISQNNLASLAARSTAGVLALAPFLLRAFYIRVDKVRVELISETGWVSECPLGFALPAFSRTESKRLPSFVREQECDKLDCLCSRFRISAPKSIER